MNAKLPRAVVAAVLTQTLIAAGTHLAAKRATASFDPVTLVTLRLVAAAAIFVLVLLALGAPRLPPRSSWRWLALYGLVAGPLNQGLFMYGLSRSRATHGGLLYALTPIGVYLVAVALRREAFSPRRLGGIAVALVGVVVLLLDRGLAAALGPLVGDLFILGAVVAWVAWTVESRAFAATHGGLRTAAWSIIAGGLWSLPGLPFVSWAALGSVDATGWACLAWLVVLASVVSYALWNYALSRVDASRVAVFANLQPVVTALAAWLVLGEPLTWSVVAGGALVLVGVRLAARGRDPA